MNEEHIPSHADAKQGFNLMPYNEKKKIRDIFIGLLEENDFTVTKVMGLKVDSEINLSHPEVQKKFKDRPPSLSNQKDRKIIRRINAKMTKKLQKEALMRYFKGEGAIK